MFVVVDPQTLVPQQTSYILDHTGLTSRGGALQQDGVGPTGKRGLLPY